MWLVLPPSHQLWRATEGQGSEKCARVQSACFQRVAKKEAASRSPLDLSPLQLTNLLYFQPCGHIPDIFNLQHSLPDDEIHSFCRCLPILPKFATQPIFTTRYREKVV